MARTKAAQWLPNLSLVEEFAVFNTADEHDLTDNRGWLYGVARDGDGLRDLGTWAQQIAEFPAAPAEEPWHGYPLYPINEQDPENRRGEKMRPTKQVFVKMENVGLLTKRMRKRLFKGDHV